MTPRQNKILATMQSQWMREYERLRDVVLPGTDLAAGPLEMSFTDLGAYGCFRGADGVVILAAEFMEIDKKARGQLRKRRVSIGPRGKIAETVQDW